MSEQLKQNARISDYGSDYNAQEFFVRSIVKRMVSTAIPVRVDAVQRAGESGGALYVDVTPLVCQTSADGKALDPVTIPHLPYFRLQHGTAAVIVDPKPGDVGLAVFAQQDSSRLNGGNEPVSPGSFRCFDMSDGFYIGGFWGQTPTTFVHIEDSGDITITAPKTVTVNTSAATVNTDTATVNASGSITFNSPTSTFTGDVKIAKTLSVTQQISGSGGLTVSGGSGAVVTGDVIADGISLKTHTHTEQGDGAETSGPH